MMIRNMLLTLIIVLIFPWQAWTAIEASVLFATGKTYQSTNKTAAATITVPIRLSKKVSGPATVDLTVTGGKSQEEDYGTGKDYTLSGTVSNTAYKTSKTTVSFAAGETAKSVTLTVVDNAVLNLDKTLKLTLSNPSSNIRIFPANDLWIKVVDNDRGSFSDADVNTPAGVMNVLLPGNGLTGLTRGDDNSNDNTAALQGQIDFVRDNGGGVLYFPAGTYMIVSDASVALKLPPGVTLAGPADRSAIIKRRYVDAIGLHAIKTHAAGAGYAYTGATDSAPLAFVNLTLDGNTDAYGQTWTFPNEQNWFVALGAVKTQAGRLTVKAENLYIKDSQSDGFGVHYNVNLNLYHCDFQDVKRGGVCIVGGYNVVRVRDVESTWTGTLRKLNIPVQLEISTSDDYGYDGHTCNDVYLDDITFDGGFDLMFVADAVTGSNLQVNNLTQRSHSGDGWYKMIFSSGGTAEIEIGDVITGATSGATATVADVELLSGTWAGGDAVGYLWLKVSGVTGNFDVENLNVSGKQDNIATTHVSFNSGGVAEIEVGDTITGATSGSTAVVTGVVLTGGSWAAGTATGYLLVDSVSGPFTHTSSPTVENLNVSGKQDNIATIPTGYWNPLNNVGLAVGGGGYSIIGPTCTVTIDDSVFLPGSSAYFQRIPSLTVTDTEFRAQANEGDIPDYAMLITHQHSGSTDTNQVYTFNNCTWTRSGLSAGQCPNAITQSVADNSSRNNQKIISGGSIGAFTNGIACTSVNGGLGNWSITDTEFNTTDYALVLHGGNGTANLNFVVALDDIKVLAGGWLQTKWTTAADVLTLTDISVDVANSKLSCYGTTLPAMTVNGHRTITGATAAPAETDYGLADDGDQWTYDGTTYTCDTDGYMNESAPGSPTMVNSHWTP